MSLNATVNRGVATAFRLLGDLKQEVIFKKRTAPVGYDFTDRLVSVPITADATTVAVVIRDEKLSNPKTSRRKLELLYPTVDVGDLSLYEEVEISGELWTIGKSPISETGHISYVQVYRGVGRP